MGTQITIVQSPKDEEEIIDFLQHRGLFLSLPRVFSRIDVEPVDLGKLRTDKQVLFFREDKAVMLAHIRNVEGTSDQYQVDRSRVRGLFIEWNRTTWEHEGEAQAGRFYYPGRSGHTNDSSRRMERTFRAMQAWIKKRSAMRSDERYPMYVGEDLSAMVREGRVRIVYPNGSEVKLVENA